MSRCMLIMAGGTGGHVFPALAVAELLRQRGIVIHWLGSEAGIENRLVPAAGIPLHRLAVRGLRGHGWLRRLMAPVMILRAIVSAWQLVRQLRPELVVGFGGYASGPGAIAARLAGVPLVIHEQNARAGLTNRLLAPLARQVLQAFPGTFRQAMTTGNPVRAEIVALAPPETRYAERTGPLRVLVTGGSQGALALNTRLPSLLMSVWQDVDFQVRHQAGRGRVPEAEQGWQGRHDRVQLTEFIDDMAEAFAWADLVICRSGASTVSEIAAAGVAALFIPLPTAVDDHQTWNARWLADADAARLMSQGSLNEDGLRARLQGLADREALCAMATRARQMALPDSALTVADICEEVARG